MSKYVSHEEALAAINRLTHPGTQQLLLAYVKLQQASVPSSRGEVGSAEYWHERFSKCLAMLEATQLQNAELSEQLAHATGLAELHRGWAQRASSEKHTMQFELGAARIELAKAEEKSSAWERLAKRIAEVGGVDMKMCSLGEEADG